MRQAITAARPTSAPSMTLIMAFVIIFFVIVLAGCAAIARRIFVGEDSRDFVIKVFISFKVILRDVLSIFIGQDKAGELQLIGVIERILCAEVVFDAVMSDVVFVCVHIILSPSILRLGKGSQSSECVCRTGPSYHDYERESYRLRYE